MAEDIVNSENLARLFDKRTKALGLLEDFKKWHMSESHLMKDGEKLLIISLTRDILSCDEDELDRLIDGLVERNDRALMKKMSKNV